MLATACRRRLIVANNGRPTSAAGRRHERASRSGLVSIAACFVIIALVDRIGRKPPLLIGSAGMAATLSALVYAFANGTLDPAGKAIEG